MLRLVTTEEEGRHRRPPSERDQSLFVIKLAVFVVLGGLVGGLLLLSGGSTSEEPRDAAAPEHTPTTSTPSPTTPTTTAPPAQVGIVPPLAGDMTTRLSLPKKTKPRKRPAYPVIGEPCDRPGAYGLTKRRELVVCDRDRRSGRLVWQRLLSIF